MKKMHDQKIIAERYILKKLIGQGGMADVYLAEDKILKRTVAVKIMRSSLTGDPVYVTRFHREASAAAALSHKNIIKIYDVGEEGDDYYIVMEYVPGQTLKELIHKRGALHYIEAVDIMKQVVSATSQAHSLGIVHRDLKPQNILVTDSGVVKIGDFGIASIQSLSQVTQTDTIMGSLHYLAPEIARGEKATVQSDIYALGIVFFELLKGEVPFNGESPVNIALKHMRDEIPSVRAFNPSIPQSVENVIIRATAKNIHDRYQNAQDMFNDLATCLSKENEEKVVFTYEEDETVTTIVADDKDFFTQTNKSETVTEEDMTEKKKLDKKRIVIIAGCVVAAMIVFGIIYFFLLRPANTFSMPDIIGLTQENAITTLESNGLKVDIANIKTELSDDVEEGLVIASDPMKNSAVKKGEEVILTVSSGKYIVIDNYIGQQYADIQSQLKELGFIVEIDEETSEKEKGEILKQSIYQGEKFAPDDIENRTIVLTVSKGYSQTVPNVYGQDINDAKAMLQKDGFKVKLEVLVPPTTVEEIKTMKTNIVMRQSLDAFTVVTKKGEEIILYYYDHIPELPNIDEPDGNENNDDENNAQNETPNQDETQQ